jgi:hypothetical protein
MPAPRRTPAKKTNGEVKQEVVFDFETLTKNGTWRFKEVTENNERGMMGTVYVSAKTAEKLNLDEEKGLLVTLQVEAD